jgi:hypothetical protein
MSTPLTYQATQAHITDLVREAREHDVHREAQHRRSRPKARRVAVILPARSHFTLVPPLQEQSCNRY